MNNLKYNLHDKVPFRQNLLYACQHVIFFLASAIVLPVVVGNALGLEQIEIAEMLQRTLILGGIIPIIQVRFGHGYPIQDGPAGLWAGILILMAGLGTSFDIEISALRADIQLGMILGGLIVLLLGITGVISYVLKLFTPLVNGILIILMVLQISPSIVKGMFGVIESNGTLDFKSIIIFLFTIIVILLINHYTKGFIKSIATFIGVVVGWILATAMGYTKNTTVIGMNIISFPEAFAWGKPGGDISVIITCILAAFILISMVFASVNGMAEVLKDTIEPRKMNRTISIHGFATILTGIFPTIAFMPFVSSTGVVKITNVASRQPFILASVIIIIIGLISPIGMFFASIPVPVGYAAMTVVFSLILGQGLNEFRKIHFENREQFIVGTSLLIGMGVMFLPSITFEGLPIVVACLFSNGLIDGIVIAIILEHIILKKHR